MKYRGGYLGSIRDDYTIEPLQKDNSPKGERPKGKYKICTRHGSVDASVIQGAFTNNLMKYIQNSRIFNLLQ